MNAGRVGPRYIFLMPKLNSARRSATAFCSYHETISDIVIIMNLKCLIYSMILICTPLFTVVFVLIHGGIYRFDTFINAVNIDISIAYSY